MADARLHLRKLVITPRGGRPFLLVEVEVTFAEGVSQFRIPGACLATLVEHLTQIRDQHPELCGTVGRVTERVDWQGGVDPRKVGEN